MTSRPLRLVRTPKPKPRPAGAWPASLGKPVDPLQNVLAARAHSILVGLDVREPRGLSADEARDVVAWHERFTRQPFETLRARAARRVAIRILVCCGLSVAAAVTLATLVAY